MAVNTLTPLQLQAAAGLLQNQALNSIPAALTTALNNINATTLFSNFSAAVTSYLLQSFRTADTLEKLLTIGSTTCAALGNSVPVGYPNLRYVIQTTDDSTVPPFGFTGLIQQTALAYLGNGDSAKFAQGFMAVQGWITAVNQFINSSVNVQTYLGPTFTGVDALITNNISNISTDLPALAMDLLQQGRLWDPSDIESYGTPAGILSQLYRVGRFAGGFFGTLQTALLAQALSAADIMQITRGQEQLTSTQWNRLQLAAYRAMSQVRDDDLQQILSILAVTLPNITVMTDLLDPVRTFPLSYRSLQTLIGTGWQPIFDSQGQVDLNLSAALNPLLPLASDCDQLSRVIPPGQAVANKAIQVAMQQITGLPQTQVAALAQAIQGMPIEIWNPSRDYLPNHLVQWGYPNTQAYRSQQSVPSGINIDNTSYWLPTGLGGLNTTAGLPLIQNQTSVIDTGTTQYFANSQGTGSGPNGTITVCDVLGTAIDHDNFAAELASAQAAISSLQTAGALTALNTAFTNILAAANDAAVLAQISAANAAISAIVSNPAYSSAVSTLNQTWTFMAQILSQERTYQQRASVDYFEQINQQPNEQTTTMAFVIQLPVYAAFTAACDAAQFITEVADQTTLGGQAMIAVMREGQNQARMSQAQISQNIRPSAESAITPVPVVLPVS